MREERSRARLATLSGQLAAQLRALRSDHDVLRTAGAATGPPPRSLLHRFARERFFATTSSCAACVLCVCVSIGFRQHHVHAASCVAVRYGWYLYNAAAPLRKLQCRHGAQSRAT